MSKTKKKKKTRLKGTDTKKPCVDCGKLKDRFKSFRPRWAGCVNHRTERGRRYFEPGCEDCAKLVNGNIRQPRCIDCDASRPKKRKAKADDPKPTKVEAKPETPVNIDPNPTVPPAPADTFAQTEPETVVGVIEANGDGDIETVEQIEASEAVTVKPQAEASEASEDVTPEPAPERPEIATTADLLKLFGGE